MSKFTGTVAFIAGLLLVILTISGIFMKNNNSHDGKSAIAKELVLKKQEVKADDSHGEGHIPDFLKISMYVTLIVSSVFVIFHIYKNGMTHQGRISSSVAFIGGILLISLGFLSTLAENEAKFLSKREAAAKMELALEAVEEASTEKSEHGAHDSYLPDEMRYTMMMVLFVGGIFTIIHVSRFGLA